MVGSGVELTVIVWLAVNVPQTASVTVTEIVEVPGVI
jgi:hypothetical protein